MSEGERLIDRMGKPAVHYEIRRREGGMSVTVYPDGVCDAGRIFEAELATLRPGVRLEVVRVEEVVVEHRGDGPPIDPWEAVKIPFIGKPRPARKA